MIQAIIVDDESLARNVLRELIQKYVPEISVVAECANVPEAIIAINKNKPNVIFLDIEMPELSGFELLNSFDTVEFEVIFVTAYSDYALRAFEVSAVDYLLKPIQILHLQNAVHKLKDKLTLFSMKERFETLKENMEEGYIKKIALSTHDGLKFININEIGCILAKGSYAEIQFMDSSSFLSTKYLRYFENILKNETDFIRVHRSTIINLRFVNSFNKRTGIALLENGTQISVARDKKSTFEEILHKKML